jgi:hypothetical protein
MPYKIKTGGWTIGESCATSIADPTHGESKSLLTGWDSTSLTARLYSVYLPSNEAQLYSLII